MLASNGTDGPEFRSVLPHEPLPEDKLGYLHVQGSLGPRKPKKKDKAEAGAKEFEWDSDSLSVALERALNKLLEGQPLIQDVVLLDKNPPFTRVRLVCTSPSSAMDFLYMLKDLKLTPKSLLGRQQLPFDPELLSQRQLVATPMTRQPVIDDPTISWTRANPPKFRRFVDKLDSKSDMEATRFVYMTGLVSDKHAQEWKGKTPRWISDCIRSVVQSYDTSGLGVEVFVAHKAADVRSCHVGMRSHADAEALMLALQGKDVTWRIPTSADDDGKEVSWSIPSAKLFLDYCQVTQKSEQRARRTLGEQVPQSEPTRPDCTSTTDHVTVPGLVVVDNFVSDAEEQVLLAALTGPHAPWAPAQETQSHAGASVRRRVQHYGYVFDYHTADVLRDRTKEGADCPELPGLEEDRDLDLESSIEEYVDEKLGWMALAGVIERTRRHVFHLKDGKRTFPHLNQMTINEYKPGDGIGAHIDTPSAFGDGLISVSLGSGIVMEFRCGEEYKMVYLQRRSLVLMSGPARYQWTHHIVTRRTDTVNDQVLVRGTRVSLTLRSALKTEGSFLELVESSKFPPLWGGNNNGGSSKRSLVTPACERDHVHAVYDAIATQWHHTRGKRGVLWPGATTFLQNIEPGSIVADIGCGDGKYFPAVWEAGSFVIGFDISRPLLKTAFHQPREVPESRQVSQHRRHLSSNPAVVVGDCMHVPLRDKSCDAAVCIAVMHHLSTDERRIRCIRELVRIVKVGGLVNVQAWAMDQEESSRRRFDATDVFVPFNAQPKYLDKAEGMTNGGSSSVAEMYAGAYDGAEYDERKGLVVFQRYCHLYRKGELEELARQVANVEVVESGFESGNYHVILRVLS